MKILTLEANYDICDGSGKVDLNEASQVYKKGKYFCHVNPEDCEKI